jgi:hypothetical protein
MHTHARGKCFSINVLPEKVSANDDTQLSQRGDWVEVYGMVSGQRGWTEEYGWLKKGPWVADFMKALEEAEAKKSRDKISIEQKRAETIKKADDRDNDLLASY